MGSTSPRYRAPCEPHPVRWDHTLVIRLVWAGRHELPVAPCRLDVSTEPARGEPLREDHSATEFEDSLENLLQRLALIRTEN